MTLTAYEALLTYADYGTVGGRQEALDLIRDVTPYNFPEQLSPFDASFDAYPEQFQVPSEICWIEFSIVGLEEGKRWILKLHQNPQKFYIYTLRPDVFAYNSQGSYHYDHRGYLTVGFTAKSVKVGRRERKIWSQILMYLLYCMNPVSPGVVRSWRRMPAHQRQKLHRSLGYPLKATTEIVITQQPKRKSEPIPTGAGGHKCLHEVKGHVRVYHRGTPQQFEVWIKPHNRGDARYGVKKTKYKVKL